MKNKLVDLNNHLFAQLERLGDEDLSPDDLEKEVQRAEAIVKVSDQVVGAFGLQVKAVTLMANHGAAVGRQLPMIENKPTAGQPPNVQLPAGEQQ